jgi:hypothetical protein
MVECFPSLCDALDLIPKSGGKKTLNKNVFSRRIVGEFISSF